MHAPFLLIATALADPQAGLQHETADKLIACSAHEDATTRQGCFSDVFDKYSKIVLDGAPPTRLQLDVFSCQTRSQTPEERLSCFDGLSGMVRLVRGGLTPTDFIHTAPLSEVETALTTQYRWTLGKDDKVLLEQTPEETVTVVMRELVIQDCTLGYITRTEHKSHTTPSTARISTYFVIPLAEVSAIRLEDAQITIESEQKRIYSGTSTFHSGDGYHSRCLPNEVHWRTSSGDMRLLCEPSLWVEDGRYDLMAPVSRIFGDWKDSNQPGIKATSSHQGELAAFQQRLEVLAARCNAAP